MHFLLLDHSTVDNLSARSSSAKTNVCNLDVKKRNQTIELLTGQQSVSGELSRDGKCPITKFSFGPWKTRLQFLVQHKADCAGTSVPGVSSLNQYSGTWPMNFLWIKKHSLYSLLSTTGSQYNSCTAEVIRSHSLRTSLFCATACKTPCSGANMDVGGFSNLQVDCPWPGSALNSTFDLDYGTTFTFILKSWCINFNYM